MYAHTWTYFPAASGIAHFFPLWRSVGDILAGPDRHPGGIFPSLWLVQPRSVALPLRAAHPHIHRPPLPKGAAVLGGYTALIGCPKRRAGHKRLGSQMDIISVILVLKIAIRAAKSPLRNRSCQLNTWPCKMRP